MGENTALACIILAAGRGTRMKSALPKAMHPIAGRPMIGWMLDNVAALKPEKTVIVISPDGQDIADYAKNHDTVIQKEPNGTGDAVKAALPKLEGFKGDILVLLGDMPFISPETMKALIKERHKDKEAGLAVLGAVFEEPPAYGRLVLGANGALAKIVEEKDCSDDERSIKLCNIGAFCIDAARLPDWIGKLQNKNAQGEYYLTDLVEIAAQDGVESHTYVTRNMDEIQGVNSRADLAALEKTAQQKLRAKMMEGGTTLFDPDTTYFSWDTKIGKDVVIEPGVFFGPGVTVADDVTIHAYSHIEGAAIEEGAAVGPFARIRPKSHIGKKVTVGNFIEVNRSTMKDGSKSKHLSYLGDTTVGEKVNIGAGTVVANYDGYEKHQTVIGKGAFIGTNSTLVAPLNVGEGALVAAGSTITYDVPADALAIARVEGDVRPGWAHDRRQKKKKA